MRNVLIPTDFTDNSIQFARHVARSTTDRINIYLFHAFEMPDSLIDAMHRVGLNSHGSLITESLRISCRRAKMNNSNIQNISFRVMHGSTVSAFRNYAEALDIDYIAIPEEYRFVSVVKESVNPETMFKKSGIKMIDRFSTEKETKLTEKPVNKYSFSSSLG